MRSMFPSELADLYDTIVDGHDKYDRNLTVVEVRELFRVNNPTATRAKRELLAEILDDISAYAPIGEDVAQDVLTKMWQQEVGRRIADMGLAMMEGNPEKIHEIKELIERSEDGFVPEDEDDAPISTDLDELLEYDSLANCWEFNIPSLSRAVRGGRAGEFMIAFARPEVGKTAFYVSLAVAPNGFCAQGADVHIITNEEPAKRTMIRAMSAYTGFSKEQLYMHREQAKQKFTEIQANIIMRDKVDASVEWLNKYCERHKPDIVIIDQLDKLDVMGTFARTDEKLRQIYLKFREVCKRHDVFGIGISQASADAENRTNVTYAMMENSKTGKAAEADLIIGIGKQDITDHNDTRRYLTISKNKLTGFHGNIVCNLETDTSRYTA
jgi:replicative DNA helicase|tara:strand:+ start:604 stop:1752 length:1149 start_codon:yes stop_codon:yes gene_type:complete